MRYENAVAHRLTRGALALKAPELDDTAGDGLDRAIEQGTEHLLGLQRDDGHWVFELEADATIPSEYVLLKHFLGEIDEALEQKIAVYLRDGQTAEGGWPLFHAGAFNISASVKAYFALKAIGDDPDAPHMRRAREAILAHGGAERSNVFTRTLLAFFGEVPWHAVPVMPVEIMNLPRWFPFHLDKVSYWSRTVIVPLIALMALKPRARNPKGVHIRELFRTPPEQVRDWLTKPTPSRWADFFINLDKVVRRAEPFFPKGRREEAIRRAVAWVTERLNGEDGLGAIYPAMANSVMLFHVLGYPPDHPPAATARRSVEKLLVLGEDRAYCQPCLSPVWDTALVAHALLEVGDAPARAAAERGLDWLVPRQVLDLAGDWAVQRPGLPPGGWAFQYANPHYPDLDDTAVVVMAMHRLDPERYADAIARGTIWVEGMQSRNGGWGAFDADNTHFHLNSIPFADHGALLDPPTADVSARCLGMLAQLGRTTADTRVRAALEFLRREQEPEGCWFGRWGTNYVYGTWSVLVALNAIGVPKHDPMVRRAATWLKSKQRPDGGWGEDCQSYWADAPRGENEVSTASQTAWALLGLMAAGEVGSPEVERGVRLPLGSPGAGRELGGGALHGGRLPARLLPPLPRLPAVLPGLGARPLPQPDARQRAGHAPRHVVALAAVTGLEAEARIARRAGLDAEAAGGGPGAATRAAEALIARGATALLSFGIAGGLDPALRTGSVVVATAVATEAGEHLAADPDLTGRLAAHLPAAVKGVLLGAESSGRDDRREGPAARRHRCPRRRYREPPCRPRCGAARFAVRGTPRCRRYGGARPAAGRGRGLRAGGPVAAAAGPGRARPVAGPASRSARPGAQDRKGVP